MCFLDLLLSLTMKSFFSEVLFPHLQLTVILFFCLSLAVLKVESRVSCILNKPPHTPKLNLSFGVILNFQIYS